MCTNNVCNVTLARLLEQRRIAADRYTLQAECSPQDLERQPQRDHRVDAGHGLQRHDERRAVAGHFWPCASSIADS
jgi:hypothetical protein